MTYKVIFTQRALKDLENIDKELQKRLLENFYKWPSNT